MGGRLSDLEWTSRNSCCQSLDRQRLWYTLRNTCSPSRLSPVVRLPAGQRCVGTSRLPGAETQGSSEAPSSSLPTLTRCLAPPYKVLPLVGRLMVRETLSR